MQLKPITVIAVLSLVVASLLVSGCIVNTPPSPTGTPTPTAKATVAASGTPQATATPTSEPSGGFNPLLVTLESKLKSEYAANKITTKELQNDELLATVSLPNGDNLTAVFRNHGSVADASNYYEMNAKESTITSGRANPTYFGQSAVKAALGHSPTVVKDTALLLEAGGAAPTPVDYEVIQYDTIVVTINHIWPNSGSFE